jgi:DICT domain-containing protein
MSLTELIAGVEAHRKTLTVFNVDDAVVSTLRDQFADRNVAVRHAETAEGPERYAVLHEGEEFVTAVSVADVLGDGEDRSVGFDDATYRPILDHLDEAMFTSFSVRKMVAASYEIEDRAWRVGTGALHAGFQTVSTFDTRRDVYERLGAREGLSVHAYAYPDTEPAPTDHVTLHAARADELADTWFVVYDGGGVDENKCALLAEERGERSFYGFWTYDPRTVDYILDHLDRQYARVETDGGDDGPGSVSTAR